jgi:GalNAc5-diNAcBac-PP-undecaprenol beta-1,3-glucosyltransferase
MLLSRYVFPSYLLKNVQFDPCMRAYEDLDFLRAIFCKKMPHHIPVLDPRFDEVPDDTTDRCGSSESALDFNAVLDYLYVYKRHTVVDLELQKNRFDLLMVVDMKIDEIFL